MRVDVVLLCENRRVVDGWVGGSWVCIEEGGGKSAGSGACVRVLIEKKKSKSKTQKQERVRQILCAICFFFISLRISLALGRPSCFLVSAPNTTTAATAL